MQTTPSSIFPLSPPPTHFPLSMFTRDQLNSVKSEVLPIGFKSNLTESPSFSIHLNNFSVSPSPHVKSLGVVLDSTLLLQTHIENITRPASSNLCNINCLLPSLLPNSTVILVYTLVTPVLITATTTTLWSPP